MQINEYSYNNFSHQIFLEAPACVGFSYSDEPIRGCTHNDTSTAADNLAAVLQWFAGGVSKAKAALPQGCRRGCAAAQCTFDNALQTAQLFLQASLSTLRTISGSRGSHTQASMSLHWHMTSCR
jgi:hypothetical protein